MECTSGNSNSDKIYKFIFESSLDAILLTSPDGSILAANPAAEALFGYSQDELCQLGRTGILDIKDPQLPILLEERRRKGKVKGELTFIRKNGRKFPGFISSHIFKDENGHERTSMTIIDLTEIKKAEMALKESEERYRYLFDTIGQGIVYQDSTGKITSANVAAQHILGLSLDEMQGRTSTDPRWKSIHEDGSDFPGENHPAMLALKTGQKIENVVMGVYDPKREEQRWIKINATPLFKKNEKLPYQVYTTFEDITNRKEVLEALQKSEERYSITLDAVNDGLWDWNVPSGDAFFSPNYYKLLGYDPGEFPANYDSWRLLVHPEDIDSVEKQLEESVNLGIGFEIDLRMKTKSGTWLWVSTRGKAIEIDLTGNATRMVGTLSDITKRKKAEIALANEKKFTEHAIDAQIDTFFVFEILTGKAVRWNSAFKNQTGYADEEILNLKAPDSYYSEEDLKKAESAIETLIREGIVTLELSIITKDGRVIPIEYTSSVIKNSQGEPQYIISIGRDIRERKKAEEELQKMASIVENSDDAIIGKDLEGTILSWNKAAEIMYGYSAEEMIGKPISLLVSPNSQEMSQFLEKIRHGEKISHYRTKRIHKSGKIIEISLTISPIKDLQGNIIGASSIARDITERVKMEGAIKDSERKYRNIFENVQDIFYQTDSEGIITEISPSIERYSGYKPEELIGKPVETVYLNPEDRKDLIRALQEKGEIIDYEVLLKSKTNDLIYVSANAHFIFDSQNRPAGVEGSLRDITERKNMELQLEKSLEEKEMLLKEIHHRVKNNLMVISSLLNLQSRYIKDKEALGIFKESQSRARSMALIHERLYQSSDLKRINFGDYIRTLAIDIFHTYASDDGRLKLTMDVDDLMLDINTTVPLGLILNELVSNCMKHAFTPDMAGEIKIDFHKNGEEYFLRVLDNGKGFPEKLDFRNTQSLGLQIVNSLTEQIDGQVDLDRSQGTLFIIKFQEKKYD